LLEVRRRTDLQLCDAVGHMSVQKEPDSEWRAIFNAIRSVHPTVPILIFGGHHHVRL
jgi:hypothetical protein